ncbi:uncharacterized protein EI97DRAFT_412468 [Westerdykella ornata]|uniref:Calcium-dependent phosphotriesterase n=1 Tax=Westerdykella ornata TaxID=318751 RepID=A0A6A6JT64_WESOR|nr:uncharacterized protein EI97DRAFT_412468 [Westerdykella ornata]KAF2279434.1 hypothetical protein EI97DRAFT_412468 [Westerdykella ornata]
MAIYIDEPRKDGLFRMHRIRPSGYGPQPGDGHLDVIAMDAQVVDSTTTRFWLLNQRPLYDAKGNVDKSRVGANITIDVYEHRKHDKQMTHVATSWSPTLHSANKIALMGGNNFVVSNQRSAQTGLRRKLDPLLGGASLVHYDDWFDKYTVTPKTLPILGSIVRGQDDHIYIPSLVDDRIRVFQLQDDRTLKQVHTIRLGMPVAGLSVDSRGAIWAVGRSKYDLTGLSSTNTVFKIKNLEDRVFKFVTEKVMEDKNKTAIEAASVALHDVKTKRIFLGGHYASGITVCMPRG